MENKRIASIDIFRGLTMILMTIVNNAGDWEHIFAPLEHAEWHGCTPTDMVFPFFLFIMCVSIPFAGDSSNLKIVTRSFRIFGLGLFLSFFSKVQIGSLDGPSLMIIRLIISVAVGYVFLGNYANKSAISIGLVLGMFALAYSGIYSFADVRIPGVLQRLALVFLVVAFIHKYGNYKIQIGIALTLLLGYWAAMVNSHVSGFNTLEKGQNFAAYVDNLIVEGHMWASSKTWDPEGPFSTIPAIAAGILGLLAGTFIKRNTKNQIQILSVAGLVLLTLGKVWAIWFPLNKALWTSSFVLFTTGWALICLSVIWVLSDMAPKWKFWTFLVMWGVNPMIVFFGSGIIPRALNMLHWGPEKDSTISFLYDNFIKNVFENPKMSSLLGALVFVSIWTIILMVFKKNKLIFKV